MEEKTLSAYRVSALLYRVRDRVIRWDYIKTDEGQEMADEVSEVLMNIMALAGDSKWAVAEPKQSVVGHFVPRDKLLEKLDVILNVLTRRENRRVSKREYVATLDRFLGDLACIVTTLQNATDSKVKWGDKKIYFSLECVIKFREVTLDY